MMDRRNSRCRVAISSIFRSRVPASFALALIAFAAALGPSRADAAELVVDVVDLASDRGDVHVAVYDNPGAFPKSDGMRAEMIARPADRRARAVFDGLPPGKYALAVYHDEDGDHHFDQGLFGIPLEDYGFSSGAQAFLGPPSFIDAAFDVSEPQTIVTISLGN